MTLKNSGVLFVSGTGNATKFLLAQEAFIEGYKNSGVWSALEGGPEHEENEIACAVRECYEESLGVVMNKFELHKVLQEATTRRYRLNVAGNGGTAVSFVLFVVRIPPDDSIPALFDRKLRKVKATIDKVSRFNKLTNLMMHKNLPTVGRTCMDILFLDLFHAHANQHDPTHMWLHYNGVQNGVAEQRILGLSFESTNDTIMFAQMVNLWNEIKNEVESMQGLIDPVLEDKFIVSYQCRACFLEKRQLRWFSTMDVVASINPNRRSVTNMRYSFAVLLSLMLDKCLLGTEGCQPEKTYAEYSR
uniref:Nudix hydrolase domain-containing protein n=1 Tax=viral metagenome TaxID=1070528 RepID=A0A6C0KDT3_9ZZZZ